MISRDGIAVVILPVNRDTGLLAGRPEMVTRGFVDMRDSQEMIERSLDLVSQTLNHDGNMSDPGQISTKVRETLNTFFYEQTKRHPMVLPVLMKV